ncbi:MAG: hypothetical protein ACKO3V_05285, partial [Pirellula sp.]
FESSLEPREFGFSMSASAQFACSFIRHDGSLVSLEDVDWKSTGNDSLSWFFRQSWTCSTWGAYGKISSAQISKVELACYQIFQEIFH